MYREQKKKDKTSASWAGGKANIGTPREGRVWITQESVTQGDFLNLNIAN